MEILPVRIVKMVAALHERGFHDIYLFSGLSPSGMHWRFCIGKIIDGCWPNKCLVKGSVTNDGELEWSGQNSSVQKLAHDFEHFYELKKPLENQLNFDYVKWYSQILSSLSENEYLVFYADYDAPHKQFLINAPGHNNKIV